MGLMIPWLNWYEGNFGMDVYVPPLRDGPRDPALMRVHGSTFVPRKATMSGFATNPRRTFLHARKADRNQGFSFVAASLGSYESCAQILIL